MAASLRIAMVGAGGIARAHIPALLQDPDVEIVAIADTVAEKVAQRISEVQALRPGANPQAFSNSVEMIRSVRPDAAYIVVPPYAHGPIEEACVELNVPFFVEKPIGLDMAKVRDIAAAVESANLLTCVGYMNRYRRGVQTARALVRSDVPVLMHGGWIGGSPGRQPGSWWVQKHLSGGQVVEQSTHTFDLIRYIGGEAVEVCAHAVTGVNKDIPGYTIEDASVVTVRLAAGGLATVFSSCAANGGGGGVWLNVFAHNATILFSGWEHSARVLRPGQEPEDIPGEEDIFAVEDRAFLKALRTGDRSGILSSYADGARTLELTLAANKAMETGGAATVGG